AVAASDGGIYIGHFDTRVKEFDMDKMAFSIPAIKLHGLRARYHQAKHVVEAETEVSDSLEAAQPMEMDLKLGDIDLKGIDVEYLNEISAIDAKLKLPELFTRVSKLDMKGQLVDLETVRLKNSDIGFTFGRKEA